MGFAESMNAVLRANKSLRKTLHRRDEHFNVSKMEVKRRKNISYDFLKATKAYLNSVRKAAKQDKRKQTIKRAFALLIAIMITLLIIGLLFVINY